MQSEFAQRRESTWSLISLSVKFEAVALHVKLPSSVRPSVRRKMDSRVAMATTASGLNPANLSA